MAKSNKITTQRRVDDVRHLIVAGVGGIPEIRRLAVQKNWQVSDRQIRRYVAKANKQLSQIAEQDHRQALGRQVAQRRMLAAHHLKNGDYRGALTVMKDEAQLLGLYPPKTAGKSKNSRDLFTNNKRLSSGSVDRNKRTALRLAAEANRDETQLELIAGATPSKCYWAPDTMLPLMMLHVLALRHIAEQQEQLGLFLSATVPSAAANDVVEQWELAARLGAYRFAIGAEAWNQFASSIGVDPDYLIQCNYQSQLLKNYSEKICRMAPTVTELPNIFNKMGRPIPHLLTASQLAKRWQRQFAKLKCD